MIWPRVDQVDDFKTIFLQDSPCLGFAQSAIERRPHLHLRLLPINVHEDGTLTFCDSKSFTEEPTLVLNVVQDDCKENYISAVLFYPRVQYVRFNYPNVARCFGSQFRQISS